MKKNLGIFCLLIFICVFTGLLNDSFLQPQNTQANIKWSALFGIISIGVAFVIITGGIDLSIGSVVGLIGCLLPYFIMHYQWSIAASLVAVALVSLGIGFFHGLLITKLKLQPFIVTLCGLLLYRGLARWWTADYTQGFSNLHEDGLRQLAKGAPCTVATLIALLGLAMAAWFAWRLVKALRGGDAPWMSLIGIASGCTIAVIGSSRFSYGFEIQPGALFYDVIVPARGANKPQAMMFEIGLTVIIPTAIAFVVTGLHKHAKKTVAPLITFIIAAGIFWLTADRLAPQFRVIDKSEDYRFGSMIFDGDTLRWIIMSIVFLVVGLFMASVAWLTTAVLSVGGRWARMLFPLVLGSSVLWLLGYTPLAATKVQMPMLILIVLALLGGIFLNHTIYGRYLLALGRNEEAARYSGINTDRMVIVAYVICAMTAGLGGVLFALETNTVQPSGFGSFYELYAIAAAVLGGCSLRGGEGTVLGVIIGQAVLRVLLNSIGMVGFKTELEFAVIGVVILIAVIVDELVKRIVAARRAAEQAKQMAT